MKFNTSSQLLFFAKKTLIVMQLIALCCSCTLVLSACRPWQDFINNTFSASDKNNLSYARKYISSKGLTASQQLIIVNTKKQTLELYDQDQLQHVYTVSTSSRGTGQILGSKKTPIGLHKITEKIGADAPTLAIFKHRTFTGTIWPKNTPRFLHKKDYIVTRILSLEGLEPGLNNGKHRGITVDSRERNIYIHGTTMEWKLGKPSTIGCVHMSSKDVTDLFNRVAVNTLVLIR